MNGHTEAKEKKKAKFRFNFIDLLMLACVALFLIGVAGASITGDESEQICLVTLQISGQDVSCALTAGAEPLEGAKVYEAEGGRLYGSLKEDYEGGEAEVILRVKTTLKGSDRMMGDVRLYIGQTVDIRCEDLLCYGATVKDIMEVTENE